VNCNLIYEQFEAVMESKIVGEKRTLMIILVQYATGSAVAGVSR
jgi:hypothetical protein